VSSERNADILALIGRLQNEVILARQHSLEGTARLLEMATLDLKCILHGISDEELRQFSAALDEEISCGDPTVGRGRVA
jgi:hypothetical protein